MDRKEFEKVIHKNSFEMDQKLLELFELNNVDERILTKDELKMLLPIIKSIVLLKFGETILTHMEDKK